MTGGGLRVDKYCSRPEIMFEETNLVGNVYFANFVRWQNECRNEWFRATSFDRYLGLFQGDLQLMVTELDLRFHDPAGATLGDLLEVEMMIDRAGPQSWKARFEMRRCAVPGSTAAAAILATGHQHFSLVERATPAISDPSRCGPSRCGPSRWDSTAPRNPDLPLANARDRITGITCGPVTGIAIGKNTDTIIPSKPAPTAAAPFPTAPFPTAQFPTAQFLRGPAYVTRFPVGLDTCPRGAHFEALDLVRWQGKCRERFLTEHAPGMLSGVATGMLALHTNQVGYELIQDISPTPEGSVQLEMRMTDLKSRLTVCFDYGLIRDPRQPASIEWFASGTQVLCCKRRTADHHFTACVFPPEMLRALRPFAESDLLRDAVDDLLSHQPERRDTKERWEPTGDETYQILQ